MVYISTKYPTMIKLRFVFLLLLPLSTFGQGLDFETTGFEIKATTLTNVTRSLLSYDLNSEEIPTQFKKFDSRSREDIYNMQQPMVFATHKGFTDKNTNNPSIQIAPFNANTVYAFGDDGGINGVKNIAYKPSRGQNIYGAYCAAVYAANNPIRN